MRVASDGGTPSEIIRRAVERGDKLFAVSTDLLRETSSDLFSGFVKVDMRVDDETGLVSSVTPMPGRVRGGSFGRAHGAARICRNALRA